jgi:hypothetical protein
MEEAPGHHHHPHQHDESSEENQDDRGEDQDQAPDTQEPPELTAAPGGPSEERFARAMEEVLRHPSVQGYLDGTDNRVLSVRPLLNRAKASNPCPDDGFQATIYDYTNNRTLLVEGDLAAIDPATHGDVRVAEYGNQPLPSEEEFAAAVDVVMHDRETRRAIEAGEIQAYRPMPPLLDGELPDGRTERTLNVGLRSLEDQSHRFVGARMFERGLVWEDPLFPRPDIGECEPPPGVDACPGTGSSGQVWVTVTQGGQTIWRLLVVRPAGSSGTNGSGVELRYVDYRGKRVLYQAHVPILNVEYSSEGTEIGCGPTYRDWQNSETCFEAPLGFDVIPGYRICSVPAQTILDSGTDSGNFRGVALYVQGQEVVLVSEMQAGWYRYISEWRLHTNGTIRPRFGFAGTANPCTCKPHHHHVYWRLDFDIRTPWNNVVEEFNDPPIIGSSNWHTKTYEIRRSRDQGHKRRWRVMNASTGEGYLLMPGSNDGSQTPFGVGDLWVLRWHPGEIDDGMGFTTDPAQSTAHIDHFKTMPELVANTDVVVWYAGHFLHDDTHNAGGSHWVGPDLLPFNL